MSNKINVYSEIGKLKKVFLHKPSRELDGLTPDTLVRHFIDDIPWRKGAERDHDIFANVLRENGVEIVYLADALENALSNNTIKIKFLDEYFKAYGIHNENLKDHISAHLLSKSSKDMVENIIAGVRKKEIHFTKKSTLFDAMTYEPNEYFYTDPLLNTYFTRDPGSCIGNGMSINVMTKLGRVIETVLWKYIYLHNKNFADETTPLWSDNSSPFKIEGGDILILSKKIVAIGCSVRTGPDAIEKLAGQLLKPENGFEKVMVFEIPKSRTFMHLDTVFTQVDYDKFTIHPGIEGPLSIFEITMDIAGGLNFKSVSDSLDNILKRELKLDFVELIRCGDGDPVNSEREQWNDGTNTLAIAPGVVVTYDRNDITNEMLVKRGVKVITIPSGELSRGRGGPRCMSQPLFREDI